MHAIQSPLTQPLPQNTGNQDVETRASCLGALSDLIKKIYETVAAFFTYLFCCRPTNDAHPSSGLQIGPSIHLPRNPIPLTQPDQAPPLNQPDAPAPSPTHFIPPSSPQSVPEVLQNAIPPSPPASAEQAPHVDLARRANQVAQETIKQIANAYAGYLTGPAESFMNLHPGVFPLSGANTASPERRLVRPYLAAHFGPLNADMRYGDEEMARLYSKMSYLGSWIEPGSVARKTHIAHLQETISHSSDRITNNSTKKYLKNLNDFKTIDCTVHRVSYLSEDFIQNHLTPEKIKEGLFLVNKSFLSTAASKMPFQASDSACDATHAKECTELNMSIQLTPDTPILDIDTRQWGDADECEILLPAGRAFKVRAYDPNTLNLDLEEVSPDSIYGTLLTTVL